LLGCIVGAALLNCGRLGYDPDQSDGDAAAIDADPLAIDATTDGSIDPDLLVWLTFESDPVNGTPDLRGLLADGSCVPPRCPTSSVGIIGNAYNFDGTDDYIQFNTVSALDFGNTGQPFSISFWYRAVDLSPPLQQVLMAQSTTGGSVSFQLSFEVWEGGTPMDLVWKVCESDCQSGSFAVAADLNTVSERIFVVGTWDGTTTRLFIDAQLVASMPKSRIAFDGNPLMVGADLEGGNSIEDTFNGAIDDFRIYRRALSQEEQQLMFNAATQ